MRTTTWKTDLDAYLMDVREKPFVWGEHDCVLFAKRAVEIVTGEPIDLGVTWHSQEDAVALLAERGGLKEWVSLHLGAAVNWGQCCAGDVVQADWGMGPGLCMHDGFQILGVGSHGLRRIPLTLASHGWRV